MEIGTTNRKSFHQVMILFYVFMVCAISGAAFWVISDLVAIQSYKQQQAISPVFSLVEDEIMAPMHIATTLSRAGIFERYFSDPNITDEQILAGLKSLQQRFGVGFYLAKDANHKQYNSDGTILDLNPDKVGWYFDLQQVPRDVQAVLGKRQDVHFYIDVKQYDHNGQFAGFIGLVKSLQAFIAAFDRFRNAYGHEFLFVNNKDQIVLSSDPALMKDGVSYVKLESMPWYNNYQLQQHKDSERSKLVESSHGDMLISRFSIDALDWDLYILTPLSERQSEAHKLFVFYILLLIVLVGVIYKLIQRLVRDYLRKLDSKLHQDGLTGLSNRQYLEQQYAKFRSTQQRIGLIIIDIDHFKQVNDKYGHIAGDLVLQLVARSLKEAIRGQDIAGRWGGDEFVILLPDSDADNAMQIAQRCQSLILEEKVYLSQSSISVTASLGVSSCNADKDLTSLLDIADQALYQAKRDGRNRICYLAV